MELFPIDMHKHDTLNENIRNSIITLRCDNTMCVPEFDLAKQLAQVSRVVVLITNQTRSQIVRTHLNVCGMKNLQSNIRRTNLVQEDVHCIQGRTLHVSHLCYVGEYTLRDALTVKVVITYKIEHYTAIVDNKVLYTFIFPDYPC